MSFKAPATDPRGIVFGGGFLWCSDRLKDQIYGIDPATGDVVIILDAPGRFCWGLAWKDGRLLNVDYQNDALFEIVVKDDSRYKTFDPRRATVDFTNEAMTSGERRNRFPRHQLRRPRRPAEPEAPRPDRIFSAAGAIREGPLGPGDRRISISKASNRPARSRFR